MKKLLIAVALLTLLSPVKAHAHPIMHAHHLVKPILGGGTAAAPLLFFGAVGFEAFAIYAIMTGIDPWPANTLHTYPHGKNDAAWTD